MTKDNKQHKLSDSTDTAIAYSTCCVSGAVSKNGISLIHGDSLQALKAMADKQFDLAIVDPPYGIGASSKNFIRQGKQTGKSMAVSGMKYTAEDIVTGKQIGRAHV